jgi:glucose-6-phosphate 1-dehydrogenase
MSVFTMSKNTLKLTPRLVSGEEVEPVKWGPGRADFDNVLSIVVIGASGDLSKKKTYPALFSLYVNGLLPTNTTIIGFARSSKTDEVFRAWMKPFLSKIGSDEMIDKFLSFCYYHTGQYDSAEAFAGVDSRLSKFEDELLLTKEMKSSGSSIVNRLFYFAIPPSVFVDSSRSIKASAQTLRGWNRVIVEKPFGRDLDSCLALGKDLGSIFDESQIYRIDHYLGKEMVQNLLVLRFANAIFEPIWNRNHISNVQITFKEPIGTGGRGGYFDDIGIIRDVMQNHLLQIASLVAMEPPISLDAEAVRDEKVKVLRSAKPLTLEESVLGQYVAGKGPGQEEGYLDDNTVPDDSTCATFALCTLYFNNPRWDGVPFILKCGKALNEKKAEVRIQFKECPGNLFASSEDSVANRNELVLRVQPEEAIYMKMNMKAPGLATHAMTGELDMTYNSRFEKTRLPDAYERLILDVLRTDHSNFVRDDELEASWKIFTPLLHRIDNEKVVPQKYEFGSRGPKAADVLVDKLGYKRSKSYSWGK